MSNYKPDPNKKVNLTIDGLPVTVPEGTTILEAARKVNIKIPTLCYRPDLRKRAVCRLCVVECDGRSKLVPACANEVWEGVKVVTNNLRILKIRKTIVELLLANHPQDCLNCVRNRKCELQTLSAVFGIFSPSLDHLPLETMSPKTEGGTLVRNMSKCIKCGRCTEVCQEVQTVRAINSSHRSCHYEISTPFGHALGDGQCSFCTQCAVVCPVGAIYGHDQTAELRSALNNNEQHVAAQIVPSVFAAIDRELGLEGGTITSGKMVTALKRLGFDRVFDAGFFADLTIKEESKDILDRIKKSSRIPMVASCLPGWNNFVKTFYPDLVNHLPGSKSPEQNFNSFIKTAGNSGLDQSKITSVSVVPCFAKKFEVRQGDMSGRELNTIDIALTATELARMIKLAGIEIAALPESPYDCLTDKPCTGESDTKNSGNVCDTILQRVYKAYTGEFKTPFHFKETDCQGIQETTLEVEGKAVKILSANGLANARKVMDSIRKGECDAAFVEIISCPLGTCTGNVQIP